MAGKTNIQKRRRLQELFARGDIIRFNSDENGKPIIDGEPREDDVAIWVGPPSPLQREMAVREAHGARARAMLEARRDEKSDQYVTAHSFLANLDFPDLVDYVLDTDENDRLTRARRDVLAEKEWEDFNALRESMRQFEEAGSPWDDPEWKDFLERDRAFGDAVFERAQEIRDAEREGLSRMPREELEKRALDKRIEMAGTSVFMRIYEEWMLLYACRDDEDHAVLFFENLEDLKSYPEEVQKALQEKLNTFITDPVEAKNSPAVGSGSASSEPQKEPETSPPSTPEESIGF